MQIQSTLEYATCLTETSTVKCSMRENELWFIVKKFSLNHSLFYYVSLLGIKLSFLCIWSTHPYHWVISPTPRRLHKSKLKVSIQLHWVPLPVPLCLARFIHSLDLSPAPLPQEAFNDLAHQSKSPYFMFQIILLFSSLCLFTCLFDPAS